MKAIIVFQSAYGHIKQTPEKIQKGLTDSGVDVKLSQAKDIYPEDILDLMP